MVTNDLNALETLMSMIKNQKRKAGNLQCPKCRVEGMTEDDLHQHFPLYHSSEANTEETCPICDKKCTSFLDSFSVHLNNDHGPIEHREPPAPKFPAFAWVIIQSKETGKFLMVNEPAGIARGKPRYWLPAGRVDAGEGMIEAGKREALEEAGLDVEITGVLRFMNEGGSCPRIVLIANPIDKTQQPKSIPDFESVGAIWVTADDLNKLKNPEDYRGNDPVEYFNGVSSGKYKPESVDTPAFQA